MVEISGKGMDGAGRMDNPSSQYDALRLNTFDTSTKNFIKKSEETSDEDNDLKTQDASGNADNVRTHGVSEPSATQSVSASSLDRELDRAASRGGMLETDPHGGQAVFLDANISATKVPEGSLPE
jgi:hypothetical protein